MPAYHYVTYLPNRPMPNIDPDPNASVNPQTPLTNSDLMAILPYPVAPPKNPQQKAAEPKKVNVLAV
jgi:hypothetical protein